jgi:hypothetical protein
LLRLLIAPVPGGVPAVAYRSGTDVVIVADEAHRLRWMLDGMQDMSAQAIHVLMIALFADPSSSLLQLVS